MKKREREREFPPTPDGVIHTQAKKHRLSHTKGSSHTKPAHTQWCNVSFCLWFSTTPSSTWLRDRGILADIYVVLFLLFFHLKKTETLDRCQKVEHYIVAFVMSTETVLVTLIKIQIQASLLWQKFKIRRITEKELPRNQIWHSSSVRQSNIFSDIFEGINLHNRTLILFNCAVVKVERVLILLDDAPVILNRRLMLRLG